MSDMQYFEGSLNPWNMCRSIAFDLRFRRQNPWYFDPCGIWLMCGAQGEGKTYSAVQALFALRKMWPAAKICSNLQINGIPDVIPFEDYSQLFELSNGIYGVIFLIDEIQVVWNSLESKNIPVSEIALFCQMRKDRRVIIGTSQVYSRVAKPIREQLKYVILCRNFMKYIQFNTILDPNAEGYSGEHDGECEGKVLAHKLFFHTPEGYQAYDTLNKIARIERKKEEKAVKKMRKEVVAT